jgi:hypothetical protein
VHRVREHAKLQSEGGKGRAQKNTIRPTQRRATSTPTTEQRSAVGQIPSWALAVQRKAAAVAQWSEGGKGSARRWAAWARSDDADERVSIGNGRHDTSAKVFLGDVI